MLTTIFLETPIFFSPDISDQNSDGRFVNHDQSKILL